MTTEVDLTRVLLMYNTIHWLVGGILTANGNGGNVNSHGLFGKKSLLSQTMEQRQLLENKKPKDRIETYSKRAGYSGLLISILTIFLASLSSIVSSLLQLSKYRHSEHKDIAAQILLIHDENTDRFRVMGFVAIALAIIFFSFVRRFTTFENKRVKKHELKNLLTEPELTQTLKLCELLNITYSSNTTIDTIIQDLLKNEGETFNRDQKRIAFLSAGLERNKNSAPDLHRFLKDGASKDVAGIIFEYAELPLKRKPK